MKKSKFLPLFFLLLFACTTSYTAMTQETFDGIALGTPVEEVREKAGEPYAVHNKGDGVEEYEYTERFDRAPELAYEMHYFVKFSQGKVVAKRTSVEKQPAFDLIYQEDPNHPEYP